MARHVFFSFHYQQDIFRVNQVRNSNVIVGHAAAGFVDASLWERARNTSDAAVKKLINDGLVGTSVTVVLIGMHTAARRFVNYEIEQSIARGNGLVGVRIHHLFAPRQSTNLAGPVPAKLAAGGYPVHTWRDNPADLGTWVEAAYQQAQRVRLLRGAF
ncbi:TIR domain-containing protein [Gemmatimonas sp.]|jgi:hypothetical protein|uniref:TIR domain-containing protein n=1 Tax=Gemmatimonas sp. TaxID=1962908 RepID=UPI00286DD466|nr:TIR domain-containing protein [Gemmatimonas sp.]